MKNLLTDKIGLGWAVCVCVVSGIGPMAYRSLVGVPRSGLLLIAMAGLPIVSIILITDIDRTMKNGILKIPLLLLGILDLVVSLSFLLII
jgi:hypothetical protein